MTQELFDEKARKWAADQENRIQCLEGTSKKGVF